MEQKVVKPEITSRIKKLEDKLSRPKGFWLSLSVLVSYFIMNAGINAVSGGMILFGIAAVLVSLICLIRYTRRHVVNNWLLAIFIGCAGSYLYCAYLLFSSLGCLGKKKAWKNELESLKESLGN